MSTLALALSAILGWHYLQGGSIVGCGGGSSCEQVLNSKWSMIAGVIPISGLAMGIYLAILVASFFIGPVTETPIRRLAWSIMLILVGSVTGSAIWFTIIQKWIIGKFCVNCITMHITGLLLTALVIWRSIKDFDLTMNDSTEKNQKIALNEPSSVARSQIHTLPVTTLTLGGMLMAGIMVALQIGYSSPIRYSDGESPHRIPVLDYNAAPMVGSPDAPYMVTLLFDYQCSHCQKIHFMLEDAISRYAGQLAFALCPAPLNTQCNPYIPRDTDAFRNSCELAKIALAVWVANREMFPAFENWMFTFESGNSWHARNLETTMAKAVELVGQANFELAWSDPWIESYMKTCVQIYGQTVQNGKGGIPKLIYGSNWVIPEPHSADDLVMILQKSLGVPIP
ncbi:MAG: thioredoxin domain-containing protein [Bacteroidales bacterium]|nr:thioredoxin domain-containing protein [Bacteroidales bacterium]